MRILIMITAVVLTTALIGGASAQTQDKFHHTGSSPKVDYDGFLKGTRMKGRRG